MELTLSISTQYNKYLISQIYGLSEVEGSFEEKGNRKMIFELGSEGGETMYCTSTRIMPATEEAAGFCIFDITTIVVNLTHILLNTISDDD